MGSLSWDENQIWFSRFLPSLSSPLQDWSKFTQIFSKMVGENVDSKQLGVAPTSPTQNRRTDEYDDQYTDYYNYWVIYNDTTITRWKYTPKQVLTLKTWFITYVDREETSHRHHIKDTDFRSLDYTKQTAYVRLRTPLPLRFARLCCNEIQSR